MSRTTDPARLAPSTLGRFRAQVRALALRLGLAVAVAACGGITAPSGSPGAGGTASTPAGPGSTRAGAASPTAPPGPGAPARPTGPTQEAALVRVVDGDTIRVLVGGVEERVRYVGIDTPELNLSVPATPDPFAEAATRANARLLAGGRLVLETDVSERDRYGRLLRDVWVERDGTWTFIDLVLVAEGFAHAYTVPPDVKYADLLVAAERAAREAGRGLWGSAAGGAN